MLLFSLLALAAKTAAVDPVIACYYRFDDPPPPLVPGHICTHFLLIGHTVLDHLGHFQAPPDDVATQFKGIKDKYPNVKLLLCQTGSNPDFSTLVENEETMTRYAKESSEYLRRMEFDGLDIDWEFPAVSWDSKKTDRARFTSLLKILRDEYGDNLLLSAAVSGPPTITRKAYEVPPFNSYLDLVNIMNYDFHRRSFANPVVGFNAPLWKMRGEVGVVGEMNSASSMSVYHQLGLWENKTLFGIPTYSIAYLLVNKYFHKPYSLAESEVPGYEKRSTICELLEETDKYTYVWNKRAASPYIHGTDKLWISIEDERSVTEKASYAMRLGSRGVMIFHVGADDVYGFCGNGEYPLLQAIYNQIHSYSNKV